jgi:hypothetical protein
VAPGSTRPDGRRWEGGDLPEAFRERLIPTIPDWLIDIIRGKTAKPLPPPPGAAQGAPWAASPGGASAASPPSGISHYAEAALAGELAKVRCASKGNRNNQLNISACAVGNMVGGGWLSRSEAEAALWDAAAACGLVKEEPRQTRSTIKGGLDRGEKEPRPAPAALRDPEAEARNAELARQLIEGHLATLGRTAAETIDPATGEVIGHAAEAPSLLEYVSDMTLSIKADALIKGLIPRGAIGALYGPSSSGKSFVGVDMAHHLALGRDWQGRRVRDAVPVLYVAIEGGSGMRNRFIAVRERMGDPHASPAASGCHPA